MSRIGLRRRLGAAALWPLMLVGSFAGSYTVAGAVLPGGTESAEVRRFEPAQEPVADRHERRVLRLVSRHACWSGAAPKGMRNKIPEHAVVTLPGRRTAYLSSDIGFAVWSGDRPGTLHAFCR
ncbi:MAG: hypothetical protein ACXWDI_03835 [Nocardioides sp.]